MANDLNQCTFTGRLGKDPEIRTAGNSKVANFSIAVGEQWKDKQGERQERTTWVNVVAWGDGLVGVIESYIKKGSRVLVQGKMTNREYEKDGVKRYATDVVLQGFDSKLIMLDSKPSGGGDSPPRERDQGRPSGGGSAPTSTFDDLDGDDVPFASCDPVHDHKQRRVL